MPMTKDQRWEQRNWFLFVFGYFAIGYLLINRFNEGRSYYYDVGFSFEADLPFFPAFILAYLLVYLSVILLLFLVDEIRQWRRTVVAFFSLTNVCFIIFLLFPVKMSLRPDMVGWQPNGLIDSLAQLYFTIDKPYNLFPSLHVAYPTLATCTIWQIRPSWRWVLLTMTCMIAVSVVLVRQHYIIDVVAGVFTALACYAATLYTERWWYPLFVRK